MARPGIMVYFDMMGPLDRLPDAEAGRLFRAMLIYGKTGVLPEFDTLALSLAWEFVKPKLDKDSEEYNRTVLKRQYATFCRDRKKKNEPEITFEEWLMTIDDHNYQVISSDNKWYPTTTTATSTTTSTTTTTAAATTATATAEPAAADIERRFLGGELGKGVVLLSNEQIEALLEKLGLDAFNYYVDKLSSFIIANDAKVKNHYETILKWWQEDGRTAGRRRPQVPKGASGKLGAAEMDNIRRLMQEEV